MRGADQSGRFGMVSRILSWNSPVKTYYSDTGTVVCPKCNSSVSVRDLTERRGLIACRLCKRA